MILLYLQMRQEINSKAAISLSFILHCKAIAALFFIPYSRPIWGDCQTVMSSQWCFLASGRDCIVTTWSSGVSWHLGDTYNHMIIWWDFTLGALIESHRVSQSVPTSEELSCKTAYVHITCSSFRYVGNKYLGNMIVWFYFFSPI